MTGFNVDDNYFRDNNVLGYVMGGPSSAIKPDAPLGSLFTETDTGITYRKMSSSWTARAVYPGIIPLDIFTAQIIGSNAIPDSGNFMDGNTAPELIRVNGATDKAGRVSWASSSSVEIQFAPFVYPPDLDDTAPVEVHLMALMAAGGTDTPVITVGYFEGIGDTNAGGNTAALSIALQELTVTIPAADVGAPPTFATVTLTPGAHTTEALHLHAAWIEYTRKSP